MKNVMRDRCRPKVASNTLRYYWMALIRAKMASAPISFA